MSQSLNSIHDDHHPHWKMTLAVMVVAQFLSGIGFSFIFPFLPLYLRTMGLVSEDAIYIWMGWISFGFGLTMAVSAPLWGSIADRYGRRLMVLRSMLAGSFVLGLLGFAQSPWQVLLLRIFQGATTGTVAASVTLVSSVSPSANLGMSLGILHTALLLGNFAGPVIGGILADAFGFRVPCWLASAILLSGTLLVYFGAVETISKKRDRGLTDFSHMKDIMAVRGFKVLMATYLIIYTLATMIRPLLPLYIEKLEGAVSNISTLTGAVIGITGFLTGLGAIFLGRVGDRLGHKRLLVISLILAGIVSFPQTFAQNYITLFVERALFGLATGGLIPAVNALVSNIISKEEVGSAYGLTSSMTCLGIGIGPMIGGVVASKFGIRVPFALMGISALIGGAMVQRFLPENNKIPQQNGQ